MSKRPKLSVCISTRNRAALISETLESILAQCDDAVEVVVLDGASTDDTVQVVRKVQAKYPQLRLVESTDNRGLDADFDRCVQAARGEYCWLFSDDDLLVPSAIGRVLSALSTDPVVVVVDARVHGPDLARCYNTHRLPFRGEKTYGEGETASFFRDCAPHLSFIGCLIVHREFWLSRERERYYGSYFVHVGVLFQAPIEGRVVALGESLVIIRFGVASWSARGFEIWMYKWPELIWSFSWIPSQLRAKVSPRAPWRMFRRLLVLRAIGAYGLSEFRSMVRPRAAASRHLLVPLAAAVLPGRLAYLAARAAIYARDRNEFTHVALDKSPYRRVRPVPASPASRTVAEGSGA